MWVVFKLMFNYWKRSITNWLFNFLFPILFLLLYGNFSSFRSFVPLQSLLPMILIATSFRNGIFGLGIAYADIKNSVIIKKIRTLPLPRWKVILGIISFNFFITWVVNLWTFLIGAALYRKEIIFSQINWLYLILAVFLATTMASIIGFLIGSFSSSVRDANNYAVLINLPAGFFSGQNIPMKMIKEGNLSKISKFIPFSYPVDIISRAFYHYNLSEVENNLLFTNYLQPIIFALLWIICLLTLAFYVYNSRKE